MINKYLEQALMDEDYKIRLWAYVQIDTKECWTKALDDPEKHIRILAYEIAKPRTDGAYRRLRNDIRELNRDYGIGSDPEEDD